MVLFSCKPMKNEYAKNNEELEVINISEDGNKDNADDDFAINNSIEDLIGKEKTESITEPHNTEPRSYFRDVVLNVYYDFKPLMIDIKENDEILFNGEMSIYNGWPPNIRMIVNENKLIGIEEDLFPEELWKIFSFGMTMKGDYKLKFLSETRLPYYDDPFLVFEIVEYSNIEIIKW
jgi:hypothetical protein